MCAAPAARITPNLLGIATGTAATAGTWALAHRLGGPPSWPATVLYLLAALALAGLALGWGRSLLRGGAVAQLRDPATAPYVCLLPIGGVSIGTGLHLPGVGLAAAACTLLVAVLMPLGRLGAPPRLSDLHPGHLLPGVVGPLLVAATLANAGFPGPARVAFVAGLSCWAVLGPLVALRLARHPLPPTRLPAHAVALAPPVLAGGAHLALGDGRPGPVDVVLLALVLAALGRQCLLARRYRRAGFRAGSWGLVFPCAAAATYLLHWTARLPAPAAGALTATLVAAVSALLGLLAWHTAVALRRGTFLAQPDRPPTGRPLARRGRVRAGSVWRRRVRPGGRPGWRRSWASSRRSARRCSTAPRVSWRPRAGGGRGSAACSPSRCTWSGSGWTSSASRSRCSRCATCRCSPCRPFSPGPSRSPPSPRTGSTPSPCTASTGSRSPPASAA